MNIMIEGVVLRALETHSDERGFFRELIRVTDDFFSEGFGQWSHSLMYDGVIKAWHLHRIQTDWWYVVSGVLRQTDPEPTGDSPGGDIVADVGNEIRVTLDRWTAGQLGIAGEQLEGAGVQAEVA